MYQKKKVAQILFTGGTKSMKSCIVIIRNSEGLHARPATFFIQKANSYKSSLWIAKDPAQAKLVAEGHVPGDGTDFFAGNGEGVRKVNAKSLLGVLSLGIAKGMTITLIADGQDEDMALSGLAALINSGFNE